MAHKKSQTSPPPIDPYVINGRPQSNSKDTLCRVIQYFFINNFRTFGKKYGLYNGKCWKSFKSVEISPKNLKIIKWLFPNLKGKFYGQIGTGNINAVACRWPGCPRQGRQHSGGAKLLDAFDKISKVYIKKGSLTISNKIPWRNIPFLKLAPDSHPMLSKIVFESVIGCHRFLWISYRTLSRTSFFKF